LHWDGREREEELMGRGRGFYRLRVSYWWV
jgi:hypothetical protein